jgi:hypothetical protein
VVFVLPFLLVGCGAPPPTTPAPIPAAPAPPTEYAEKTAVPIEPWTYADSLEELHGIWSDRFALSAAPEIDRQALWPYADAVLIDGDSWGLVHGSMRLVYTDTDGHAYQMAGESHPTPGDARTRQPLTPDALAATGWSSVRLSPGLLRVDDAAGFRVTGPLHAGAACLVCHDGYRPQEVVGILIYDFSEIPDD